MRPMYEDDASLSAEVNVIEKLSKQWKVDPIKLPIAYYVDYAMTMDGAVKCWLEVKCRHCTKDQYPTYFISAKKISNGIALAETTGKPFLLAVQWKDCLGWIDVKRGDFDIRVGGRADRNDWQDIEPMAHFNTDKFNILGTE